jgi:drug/metabolite transporter (DMT)-like permease
MIARRAVLDQPSPNSRRLGLLLVTLSAIAWSTAGLVARMIDVDLPTMLVWRGVFGAAGIAAVLWVLRRTEALRDVVALGYPGWIYALLSAAGMIFFIASLRLTTVAHVAIIYATVPLVAAFLGWMILRAQPTARALAASLLALAGVVLMVGQTGRGSMVGNLAAFAMTLSMALMMIMARRFPEIPTLAAAGLSALLCAAACWPMAAPGDVSSQDMLWLAMFGLVNSAIGLALFTIGARYLAPVETALVGALDAPLAPFWVRLIFAETPDVHTMAGGAIVFAAVIFHITTSTARRAVSAEDDAE